jgi:hypothetical protein
LTFELQNVRLLGLNLLLEEQEFQVLLAVMGVLLLLVLVLRLLRLLLLLLLLEEVALLVQLL